MKIIITEAQYRLLKEEDESLKKIVSLLLSPQSDNKKLGLYFIESQDVDLDEIVDLLLKSKDIYDVETFETILNAEQGIYFYFPKDIFKITLDSLDEDTKIVISSKTETYYSVQKEFDSKAEYDYSVQKEFDSKAEYDYFIEDIYDKLRNSLKAHLMKEISRLKN